MVDYLTQDDVDNYGPELINVTQRAALQAVAPHLQNLESQNAQLQQRLAVESRRRLDDQVARAVPDYQAIDRDPRWHRWLLGVDSLSGRVRQQWLNDAISAGDAARVKFIFDSFRREVGSSQAPASTGTTSRLGPFSGSRSNTSIGTRTYTTAQIHDLYEKRRKGGYSDDTWKKIEADVFAAQKDGRIVMTPYLTK